MCFSATASFIAGAALTVAGAVAVSQVKKPSHLLFACIPVFFGIQQLCEGILWLSFTDPGFAGWHDPAKYTFLIFAQVIWPFWIPLAFMKIERLASRRSIMRYFLYGGIVAAVMLTYRLIFYTAVADIEGCHIAYHIDSHPVIQIITGIFYLGAIVVAPFFSSWKKALILASVNVISLLATELFFHVYFVSVWCFFAAVQSVLIVLVMREIRNARAQHPLEDSKNF
jgi:hypothetical protein